MVAVTWPCVAAIAVPAWLVGTLAAWVIVCGSSYVERRERRQIRDLEASWKSRLGNSPAVFELPVSTQTWDWCRDRDWCKERRRDLGGQSEP